MTHSVFAEHKAPCSFSIARALWTKPFVICAPSKENACVFRCFNYDVMMSTKAKLRVNFLEFSLVKFRKIWQSALVNILVWSYSFRKIYSTGSFSGAAKGVSLPKKNCLDKPYFFGV